MSDGQSTWGQSGTADLYKIFVSPFTDVVKTVAGKSKELVRSVRTLLHVAFEAVVTTILPFVEDSYDEIFEKEKSDMAKIKSQYQSVYDANSAAFEGDAKGLAFLMAPGPMLAAGLIKRGPDVALRTLSVLTGGLVDGPQSGGSSGGSSGRRSKLNNSRYRGNLFLFEQDEKEKLNKVKELLKNPKVLAAMEKTLGPIRQELVDAKIEKADAALKLAQGVIQAKSMGDIKKVLSTASSKAEKAVEDKIKQMKDVPPEMAKQVQEMLKSDKLPKGSFDVLKKTFTKPLEDELKTLKNQEVIDKYKEVIRAINSF
jgi:hypothetical protein